MRTLLQINALDRQDLEWRHQIASLNVEAQKFSAPATFASAAKLQRRSLVLEKQRAELDPKKVSPCQLWLTNCFVYQNCSMFVIVLAFSQPILMDRFDILWHPFGILWAHLSFKGDYIPIASLALKANLLNLLKFSQCFNFTPEHNQTSTSGIAMRPLALSFLPQSCLYSQHVQAAIRQHWSFKAVLYAKAVAALVMILLYWRQPIATLGSDFVWPLGRWLCQPHVESFNGLGMVFILPWLALVSSSTQFLVTNLVA